MTRSGVSGQRPSTPGYGRAFGKGYREQFERVQRWYERFRAVAEGNAPIQTYAHVLDEVHAFFQNCFHLATWIRNDDSVDKAARDAVESFVTKNEPLARCANIANGTKHHILRAPTSSQDPHIARNDINVDLNVGVKYRFWVASTTGEQDAFELATDCVRAWETFLQRHSL